MQFQVLSDQDIGRVFAVTAGTGTIGRGSPNAIALDDPKVSRQHASLEVVGEEAMIEDLGSSNGTFVNDVRLAPHLPQRIHPGDIIRVGKTRLRYDGLAVETVAASGFNDFALDLEQAHGPVRPGWLRWAVAGVAVAIVALVVIVAKGGDLIGLRVATETPDHSPVILVTPDTPTPPVAVTRPPEPTPTPRPSATPPPQRPTPADAQTQTGTQGMAPSQGPPQPQMPPSAEGLFAGVPPEQLPLALAEGVLSGQISPEAAQGMVQEMFPGVPPEQLPAVLAQSLQSIPPDQMKALMTKGFPLMNAP